MAMVSFELHMEQRYKLVEVSAIMPQLDCVLVRTSHMAGPVCERPIKILHAIASFRSSGRR
jgi:hypothetical protein